MMGNIQIMKRFVEKIAFLGLSPTKVSSVAIKLTENLEACYIDWWVIINKMEQEKTLMSIVILLSSFFFLLCVGRRSVPKRHDGRAVSYLFTNV